MWVWLYNMWLYLRNGDMTAPRILQRIIYNNEPNTEYASYDYVGFWLFLILLRRHWSYIDFFFIRILIIYWTYSIISYLFEIKTVILNHVYKTEIRGKKT